MLNELAKEIYQNNVDKGFYEDYNTLLEMMYEKDMPQHLITSVEKAWFGQRVSLMHSELSEAIEANRKDLMDDKLTQYKGEDVELVDNLIRTLDTLAHRKVDIDTVVAEKLAFNKARPYRHGKNY